MAVPQSYPSANHGPKFAFLLLPFTVDLPVRQRHVRRLRVPHVLLGDDLPRVLEAAAGGALVGVGP